MFLIDSFADGMRRKYNNRKRLNCEVEEISNLKFYECTRGWTIGYSVPNSNGYSSEEILKVGNTCFKTLRTYFREKAKKDNVKIKAYSL